MPRAPRLQVAGGIFHVTARGNRRQSIYHDDYDRQVFLILRDRIVERFDWRILAYCLMTNHFHLVIETEHESLSTGMHQLNGGYARKFNDRHTVDGHLFEGRFRSTVIESDDQFEETLRYVALNPVRAGLCEHPSDWPWSSFRGVGRRYLFDR
jgi:REP-associated tyrosine transposase